MPRYNEPPTAWEMEMMTREDCPRMSFSDIMGEFRLMCSDDTWGDSMEFWFAVAGEMFERGLAIPDEWKYRPGLFGGKDSDSYWTEMLETVSDEDLSRLGRFISRYTGWLKKAGKDYE